MNFPDQKAQPTLVDFDNGVVRLHSAPHGAAAEQRRGNAAEHIGAVAVIYDGKSVFPQNMSNHIRGGGLSVGAGNADYLSVEPEPVEHMGADRSGDVAGLCRALAHQFSDEPKYSAQADGNKKPHFKQTSFILYYIG